jgi:hypothetical protein
MFFRLVFFWSGVYMIPSSRIVICFWCYCCLVMIHGFVFIRAEHLLYGGVTDTAHSFCVIEFLLVRSQHSPSLNFSRAFKHSTSLHLPCISASMPLP